MTESIEQGYVRKINNWCIRHGVSRTLPFVQKETLYELYRNPHCVPSEEVFIAMLKATPCPLEHKRTRATDDWGAPLQAGWRKT